MKKIINPAKFEHYNGRHYPVFVTISFERGRLSITGVEGPHRGGNCYGSCGQVQDNIKDWQPVKGWNRSMLDRLFFIWDTYHLNDLTPNCEHMRDAGTLQYTPGLVCPVCGYESGTKWLSRNIPADVIAWLESLPETQVTPAWA